MQILSQAQRVCQVPSRQLENAPASKEALMFLLRSKVRRLQQQQCEGDASISQQTGGAVGCCRNIPTSDVRGENLEPTGSSGSFDGSSLSVQQSFRHI